MKVITLIFIASVAEASSLGGQDLRDLLAQVDNNENKLEVVGILTTKVNLLNDVLDLQTEVMDKMEARLVNLEIVTNLKVVDTCEEIEAAGKRRDDFFVIRRNGMLMNAFCQIGSFNDFLSGL